jgi:aerobic-type carbon monoxide dehydrogenase small subunit (CoxS/CutS family)
MAVEITVNGRVRATDATSDTPLLYVLRDELRLRGPKFGCGLSQCGACSVLVDGKEIRSCVTPVAAVVGKKVTTLEGLPAWYAEQKTLPTAPALHPLQQAWIDEQVPQCGYCQNGMIIMAADLLSQKSDWSDADIKQAMDPHLCRCATHNAIVRAIKRAAEAMS